jgi:hypothetical protein
MEPETTAQNIAGGAGLFSSILGPIGVGVQLFGAGMQIAQAAKARRAQRSAERAAEDKAAQARRELSVNRLEGLQIPTSAFEQAAQADIAMQQQALAGLAESDPRALAAGLGKVQAMGTQATETRRQAMEKSLFDYEKMVAAEQQRLDRAKASISLQEAAGAQEARAAAEEQYGQAMTGAIGAIGGAAQTAYQQTQLYRNRPDEQTLIEQTGLKPRTKVETVSTLSPTQQLQGSAVMIPTQPTGLQATNALRYTQNMMGNMPQSSGGFGGLGQAGAYSSGLTQFTPSGFSIGNQFSFGG